MPMRKIKALTLLPISIVFNRHDFVLDKTSAVFCLYQQYLKQLSYCFLFVQTSARKSVGLLGDRNCDFGFSRLWPSILLPC
jgi:hypothetical protein